MDEKKYEEVPVELQTHNPSDYKSPAPTTPNPESGGEVPANLMVNQPQAYSKTKSAFSPNTVGLIGGALTGTAAVAAQKGKSAADWIDKKFSVHPGIQNYIDSQIGSDFNLTAKELAKITGMPVETQSQAQQAIKKISGSPEMAAQVKPVYEMVNGVPTITRYEHIPGAAAVDPLDLSPYKKTPSYHIKKHGELPLRSAIAGYDIAKGLQQLDSPAGYGDIAAGAAIGAAPFIPKSVKGVPVRAIATGLGLLPIGSEMVSSASAADVPGTAFDVATGLMGPAGMMLSPSQLGEGTVQRKREVYRPGMNVLQGSTLPPEQRAQGGLVHLAEGGESNTGPFIGYPRITNKPRDPNFKQQSGPVLGALDALIGAGPRSDISLLNPQDLKYTEAYEKFEPYGIAANVLPVIGGPLKAVGRTAARELGPKAAGMAEDYLTRIGGIANIVPNDTKIVRASEAFAPHEGKWLNTTQSDRMRSTGGDLGGPGFSRFQQIDPAYKDAAWGVGKPGTATGIVNLNQRFPEGKAIWAPMIGAETQHHSNQHVYDALTNEFNRQAGLGKLTPALRDEMNQRLTQYPEYANLFKKGIDVSNPEQLASLGDTFDRRGAIATVLSGKGVGGKKGQIFDYPGIMQEMTDPMTIGAPTHSVGTRLFTLNNQIEHRPDLHSAFPYILKGQDQGVAFNPIPKELAIPDWLQLVKDFKGREAGYMDFTRGLKGKGTPNQFIDEKWLRNLEKAGHAAGGKIARLASDLVLPAAENAARTQIIGTLPTYGKAAEALAQHGAQGRAIDFGAGLGEGAKLLGPNVDTYEPFAKNWKPTFTRPEDIPTDAYGRLTNLNVLNVVPREARDEIVQHIGRVMEPGGRGIVTTRGADVMKAQGQLGPEPMSMITSRDTYQKGFTKQELEDYMKYMLGNKFDVNKFNLGPAGVMIQKKADGGPAIKHTIKSLPDGLSKAEFEHMFNKGHIKA